MGQPTQPTNTKHPIRPRIDIEHAKRNAKQLKRALADSDIKALKRLASVFGEHK